jgi:hypothetical protein
MPLSSALPSLETQIFTAMKKAQASNNPESATRQLARELAQAIHAYTLQATVNPGQAVATSAGAGSTVSPGTLS